MTKRLFAIALAAVISMSMATLVGCGEQNTDNVTSSATPAEATKTTNSTISTTAPATTQSTTAATTAATTAPTEGSTKANSEKSENKSSNSSQSSGSVAVTSVSLSKSSISLYEGDSSTFEVTINPSDATDRQYNVVTNNGNASIDCNGSTVTVYGENSGSCDITVSSTNGKSATCSVSVNARTSYNNGGSGNGGNSGGNSNGGGSGNSGVITDDTLLTHEQLCSERILDRLMNKVNTLFQQKGMTYNSSLTKNSGVWLLSGTNYYPGDYIYSANSFFDKELQAYEGEVEALVNYDGNSYSDFQFRCYYEKQSNGEYYFYFCYC